VYLTLALSLKNFKWAGRHQDGRSQVASESKLGGRVTQPRLCVLFGLICCSGLLGCTSSSRQASTSQSSPSSLTLNCAGLSPTTMNYYDQMTSAYLTDSLRNPVDNTNEAVIWNTRYYLDSLITAYAATGNPKYAQAFVDSGTWVMNLVKTIPVLNAADPTAPGAKGPVINVTGWPELIGNYGVPAPVPDATGAIAMYAQSLVPWGGPAWLQILAQNDGSLKFTWFSSNNQSLQTNNIANLTQLQQLAAQPLVAGVSQERIFVVGGGMPAPGAYHLDTEETAVWHEQTGGILLPFAQFLLLAHDNPGIADSATLDQWRSKILSIASGYEDEFVSDGSGGLRFHNPQWLPNSLADTDAASDYIFVEAELRMVLYKLTSDPHQLELAKGLILHQQNFHWQISPEGWLELKFWPCIVSWSTRANAPAGSIWDEFQYNSYSPAPSTDASFAADLLNAAVTYDLVSQLGISSSVYQSQRAAFIDYMLGGLSLPFAGPKGFMRQSYPTANSTSNDSWSFSADPWAPSAWASPTLTSPVFTNANWNWMMQYGQNSQGYNPGYFLRAWARSEAAQLTACSAQGNSSK